MIFLCCEQPLDFDTDGEGSVNVSLTEFTTPSNTTVDTDAIRIEWEDNLTALIFDYKLEYVDVPEDWTDPHSWIEWDTTSFTSVNFSNLDEGDYIFYIKGRFDLDNIGAEATLPFTVNAITDTALRIYPQIQKVALDDSFYVYVYAENIANLSAAEIVVGYEESILEYISSSLGCANLPDETSDGSITKLYCDLSGNYSSSESLFRLRFRQIGDGDTDINILGSSTVGIDDGNISGVNIRKSGRIEVVE